MKFPTANTQLNIQQSGPSIGAPLVLLHSFGGHLGLWAKLLPHLPETLRVISVDLRGHGASDVPNAPYSMGAMIKDVEGALEQLKLRDAVVLGLGLGGLVAQGLAVKRLDQVRALILCNTAAKIGHAPHWQSMIDEVKQGGQADLAARLMPLWFHRAALSDDLQSDAERAFRDTDQEGLVGSFHAVMGTDFYTPTSGLRLPCLGLAGAEDRFVPPDMTRETVGLIPGSDFILMRRTGHLPAVDQPEAMAEHISAFLKRIGHC